jgi:lipoate-protein ligase A
MDDQWVVEERSGGAGVLHARWPGTEAGPEVPRVAICRATGSAVVLGSTQPAGIVDPGRAEAAGLEVVRRRSGGGAVLVTPDDPVWIDVWLPAGHALWRTDVGRAFDWLGDVWVRSLATCGVEGLTAHRSGYVSCTRWSSSVCFGGVGTGEVVTADGRKVVGLAQRRNRQGAWFHGACIVRWDPAPLVDVLAMDPEEREAAVDGLAGAVVGVEELLDSAGPSGGPRSWSTSALVDAFVAALPTSR